MEAFPEPGDECLLGGDEMGKVRVYHEHDVVWIVGYGAHVGLGYQEVVDLFNWLSRHRAFLLDRANNYYECRECASMHRREEGVCPMLPWTDGS